MNSSPLISCLSRLSLRTLFSCFASDVAEKCGQAVVVVLGPDVEGMVMAASALEPNAQEDLADGFGRGHGVAVGPVKAGRGVLPGRAQPGDNPAGQLVERRVARDLVAQPALKDPGTLLAHRLLFISEQVGPLQGPVIGELGALDQPVNQLAPFIRVARVEERAGFVGIGEPSNAIEVRAPEKLGIARQVRTD